MRLDFTIAVLNKLDILVCGIPNSYLVVKCRGNIIYITAGLEFGSEQGLIIIVKIALYTLKNSGVVFRLNLVSSIWNVEYCPTKVNPDIWIRPAI